MRVAGRLALAGACVAAGGLVTWGIYTAAPPDRHAGDAGSRELVTTAAPGAQSTLWVVAVGVSRYQAPELELQFADADAGAMAETIQSAAHGGRYREIRSLVLTNEQVTRASMLDGLSRFLGGAGPDDVVAIFVAGHGVRDLSSGSYYFLPYPANADNLLTEGLRMSDFDEMLRVVRRNVRATLVMLDTCHAGALDIPARRVVPADAMAAQISAGEGFFLLAASKPGEDSKEKRDLGHGAFTYAVLEGLRGAADADSDGALTISELFGYVARRVPNLTEGRQHPYHKTEGTDLVFLTVAAAEGTPRRMETLAPPVSKPTGPPAVNTIGVIEFHNLRANPEYDWISKALRVAFITELSKVQALKVFSPELIDRTARARGADSLYTARELGIGRLLTGSFHVTGRTLRIDARIVDATSGVNEASDSVEGDLGQFFTLQKDLVLSMLRRLRVQVLPAEGQSIQTQTNTDVDAYRLLLEAEGVVEPAPDTQPTLPARQPGPQSRTTSQSNWLVVFPQAAQATEPQPAPAEQIEQQIHGVLEGYRRAIEAKHIDEVALLYRSFSDPQRQALRAYLESAQDLSIELSDVTVIRQGAEVAVSFTRRDRFLDSRTGRPVRLEVRLTKILVRDGAAWKIGGSR